MLHACRLRSPTKVLVIIIPVVIVGYIGKGSFDAHIIYNRKRLRLQLEQ
jgi:hypothetical protein